MVGVDQIVDQPQPKSSRNLSVKAYESAGGLPVLDSAISELSYDRIDRLLRALRKLALDLLARFRVGGCGAARPAHGFGFQAIRFGVQGDDQTASGLSSVDLAGGAEFGEPAAQGRGPAIQFGGEFVDSDFSGSRGDDPEPQAKSGAA